MADSNNRVVYGRHMVKINNNGDNNFNHNNNFDYPWDKDHKADIRNEIKSVIDKLSKGEKIEGDNFFLKGYDDGNSVFDSTEIDKIKNDYESGVLENILYKGIDQFELKSADFEDAKLQKEYNNWKKTLSDMSNEEFEHAREICTNVNDIHNFDKNELVKIANLPQDKYKKATEIMQDENIKVRLNADFLLEFVHAQKEVQERVLKIVYNKKQDPDLLIGPTTINTSDVFILASLDEDKFNKIESLLFKEEGQNLDISTLLFATELDTEGINRIKELTSNPYRDYFNLIFTFEDITEFTSMTEEQYNKVKPFLNIPEREDNQLRVPELKHIAEIDNSKLDEIKDLLINKADKFINFNIYMAEAFTEYSKEQKELAYKYLDLNLYPQFNLGGIHAITHMPKERLAKFDKILEQIIHDQSGDTKPAVDLNDIALGFLNTPEKSLKRLSDFAYMPKRGLPFRFEEYSTLLEMSDVQYNEVRDFMTLRCYPAITANDLAEYLQLDDTQKDYVKKNVNKTTQDYVNFRDLLEFSKYTDEQMSVISEFEQFLIPGMTNRNNIKLIANSVKPENAAMTRILYDKECIRRNPGTYINDSMQNMNITGDITLHTAIVLGNMEPELREEVLQILESDENIDYKRAFEIAKIFEYKDALPEDFYNNNHDFSIKYYSPLSEIMTISEKEDCDDTFSYDKNGLIEYRINNEENNSATITNVRTNTVQEIQYKTFGSRLKDVERETVSKYDENNQLIERRTSVPSGIPGISNVSIYKDGKEIPIQFATIDQVSGSTIIQKDFISPTGTRTQMYIEDEPEGVRISSLTITDKNGKVLLKREITFEQVSDNEFITSVNGNAYRAVFDDEGFTITDQKNNKTVKFAYEQFITECNDEIIKMLKYVPANMLMTMAKKPVIITRDYNLENNANASGHTINMGNFEYTDNVKDVLVPVFMHEFGHHLDFNLSANDFNKISENKELNEIFQLEYDAFIKNTTCSQQKYVDYFTDYIGASKERTAEANMIINGGHTLGISTRALYYLEFFPKTIAMQAKLLDERIKQLNE